MFGFLIGIACLIGLVKVLRGGSRCGWHGRHHWHRHPPHGGHHGPGRPWSPRWLHAVFARLDTSPGQEKEIRAAMRELFDEAWEMRGEMRETRKAVVDAFGDPLLDESALDERFAEQDQKIVRVRAKLKDTLRRVHDALDDEQRAELASWMKRWGGRGPRSARPFGPYR